MKESQSQLCCLGVEGLGVAFAVIDESAEIANFCCGEALHGFAIHTLFIRQGQVKHLVLCSFCHGVLSA